MNSRTQTIIVILGLALFLTGCKNQEESDATQEFAEAFDQHFGTTEAQFNSALALYQNGDHEDAHLVMSMAAEDGYGPAQAALGEMYMDGIGTAIDLDKAEKWLIASAEDVVEAQKKLFFAYYLGQFGNVDKDKALIWLKRGAEAGSPVLQHTLANAYYTGDMVIQSEVDALEWMHKSAAQGYIEAEFLLGEYHRIGVGGQKNAVAAASWYRKAAENTHPEAMEMLGRLYAVGEGTPQDFVMAHQWLNLSAAHGNEEAIELRSKMREIMSSQEIAQAEALARQWMKKHGEQPN